MWTQMLRGPFAFEQAEVIAPHAGSLAGGQVLVKTLAGAICGSDLPNFRGAPFPMGDADDGFWATRAPGFPLHEIVGEIVASEHPEHSAGDRVVGWASAFNGIAELVVSDGAGLARYDTALAPTTAVMLQPLACVLYAVEQLGDVRDKTVAVIGQGPIGLLFSHVLKARGAAHVIGVDRIDRSDAGTTFGVDEVVPAAAERWAASLPDSGGPHVVVEAVGHQVSTLKASLEAVAFGGEVFYFGIPDDWVYPFDIMTFLRKNLTLRSGVTLERRRVLEDANTYLGEHPDLRDAYISHVFGVSDVEDAFMAACRPTVGQFKIAIDMA